jgi:hypothetical protein
MKCEPEVRHVTGLLVCCGYSAHKADLAVSRLISGLGQLRQVHPQMLLGQLDTITMKSGGRDFLGCRRRFDNQCFMEKRRTKNERSSAIKTRNPIESSNRAKGKARSQSSVGKVLWTPRKSSAVANTPPSTPIGDSPPGPRFRSRQCMKGVERHTVPRTVCYRSSGNVFF